jgi:single-strand DNA-binding protein
MNSINILGRLTKQPELKTSQSGKYYSNFSIAVNTGWGDNRETSFFNCMAFGKTAETVVQYFSKGHRILIDGSLKQDSWTDKEGNKKTSVSIIVNRVDFIEPKNKYEQVKDEFTGADVVLTAEGNPFGDDDIPF